VTISVLATVIIAAICSTGTGDGESGVDSGVDAGSGTAGGYGTGTTGVARYQMSTQGVELDLSQLWFFLILLRQREGPPRSRAELCSRLAGIGGVQTARRCGA
jgi:hypothetical protein